MRSKRVIGGLAGILVSVLAVSSCGTTTDTGAAGGTIGFTEGDGSIVLIEPTERAAAPDLVGQTVEGKEFRLSDYAGQTVVLNVWASWCAPCRAEAPILRAVANDFADKDVQFVGLVTRDSETSAQAFAKNFELDYPQVMDKDGALQLLFRDTLPPSAIPSTLVIDPQQRIAGRVLGEVSGGTLTGLIEDAA